MAHERTGLVAVTLITGSAAISGLLFGYDTAVVNGALVFLRAQFNLTAFQTELAATSLLWGCVLGAAMAGYLCDRYGRRRVLMLSGVLFVASAIGAALPTAAWQFLLARLVGGVAIGCASLVAPLYIAEISPAAIRGRLISVYQLAIVIGILVAYVSNYFVARLGPSSWRWMFGLGATTRLLSLPGAFLDPGEPAMADAAWADQNRARGFAPHRSGRLSRIVSGRDCRLARSRNRSLIANYSGPHYAGPWYWRLC